MNYGRIASKLENTPIDNLEKIAKNIKAPNRESYAAKYAQAIAKQTLTNSPFDYKEHPSKFDYIIEEENGVLVGVVPTQLFKDTHKIHITNYIKVHKPIIEAHNGLVLFLPFQMNGKLVRDTLERNLDVSFVNMKYDPRSIDRRFKAYATGIPKYY